MTAPTAETAGDDTAPGRPACDHWIGAERRYCRETGNVRRFIPGLRCPIHTPNALSGRSEVPAGPGWPIHRQQEEQS